MARSTVNDRIGYAKQIFKWGAENDLIPPETYARVASLKPLVAGRSAARETAPVEPVSDDDVERTCLFLSQTVRDAVVFMRLTGCRPGEAFRFRWRDVDRSGVVWLYYPSEWNTERRQRSGGRMRWRHIAVFKGVKRARRYFPSEDFFVVTNSPSRNTTAPTYSTPPRPIADDGAEIDV